MALIRYDHTTVLLHHANKSIGIYLASYTQIDVEWYASWNLAHYTFMIVRYHTGLSYSYFNVFGILIFF